MRSPTTSRTVAVAGASGFIGRALVRHLLAQDCRVRAISRRGCGLGGADDHQLPDWHDPSALAPIFQGVDTVLHLAALAHQQGANARGDDLRFAENLQITRSLLQASRAAGVRRLILVSSIGVNGTHTTAKPFTETDAPAPAEAYARSKLACEQRVWSFCTGDGAPEAVVVRPPLVYGPQAPGNFGRLMRAVASGLPLPLGAIHNRRSLIALDNLLDFLTLCIDHPAAAGQTFLVADGEDISTTDLLRRAARASGRRACLLPVPAGCLRVAGALIGQRDAVERLAQSLQIDITKARQLLNWRPPIDVDEGLRRALSRSPA